MREISTEKIRIGEHVMIDGVEYVAEEGCCDSCITCQDTGTCGFELFCPVGGKLTKVGKKPSYRPYMDTDELIEDWKERFKAKDWPSYSMPLVWVKSKTTSLRVFITAYNMYSVVFGGTRVDFRDLFDNYTYLDGSPCGKEVTP